jgi:hypothetical protein
MFVVRWQKRWQKAWAMSAILHNSSYNYTRNNNNTPKATKREAIITSIMYTLLGMVFMAGFLFFSLVIAFYNCEERTTYKVLFVRWITKNVT